MVACKLSVRSELFAVQVGTNFARFSWLSILLETIPCLRNTPRVLVSEMYEKYSTFSYSGSGQNKGRYNAVWSDFFRNLELLSNSIFCCWTFFWCFPMNCVKFLTTTFLQSTSGLLLLKINIFRATISVQTNKKSFFTNVQQNSTSNW